jgi:hypothetical protein
MILRIESHVKIRHLYTCYKCGKKEYGTTQYFNIINSSTLELGMAIRAARPSSHYMPVGWGYDDDFYHVECKS